MMALSIRQPWAWLIVNGHKDVENRDWSTNLRGEFLVHAGKELDRAAHDAIVRGIHPVTGRPSKLNLIYPAMQADLGGIVGIAEIHGCVTQHASEWFVGRFGFLIRNARPLPFQPCRGRLGFFEPEREHIDTRPIGGVGEGQGRLL